MRAVRIVGSAATGKSTLRVALADAMGVPSSSIDDERLRILRPGERWPKDDRPAWEGLRSMIEAGPCIIETSGRSPRDAWLFDGVSTFTVLCVAEDHIRIERLIERVRTGYPFSWLPGYVSRLAGEDPPALVPDLIWHGNGPAPLGPLSEMAIAWLAQPVVAA
jgi:hypothetical protein